MNTGDLWVICRRCCAICFVDENSAHWTRTYSTTQSSWMLLPNQQTYTAQLYFLNVVHSWVSRLSGAATRKVSWQTLRIYNRLVLFGRLTEQENKKKIGIKSIKSPVIYIINSTITWITSRDVREETAVDRCIWKNKVTRWSCLFFFPL